MKEYVIEWIGTEIKNERASSSQKIDKKKEEKKIRLVGFIGWGLGRKCKQFETGEAQAG